MAAFTDAAQDGLSAAMNAERHVSESRSTARKIGLFVNDLSGYPGSIVRETRSAARDAGLDVEVFDAQRNAAKQAHDVMRFAQQNSDQALCALVVPETDALHEGDVADDPIYRVAQRLARAGVGWVTLNHGREDVVTALSCEFPLLPIALVAVDNVEFGRVQGRQLQALLPEGGAVLCVRGHPCDTACRDRSDGLRVQIEGGPIVLHAVDGRWDAALSREAVQRWVTSPARRQRPLHGVVAQNDPMALAARAALDAAAEELRRPELRLVPVIGGDGLPDVGLPAVDEGLLTATVQVRLPGGPAVDLLARHWHDGSPLPLVTRLAVQSYPPTATLHPRAH